MELYSKMMKMLRSWDVSFTIEIEKGASIQAMWYKISEFEKKTPSEIEHDKINLGSGEEIKVYLIKTVHDLTQFIGYGKYMNCQHGNVFLRGQTSLYNGRLIPSLYRGRTNNRSINTKYNYNINELKRTVKSFSQYERKVLEPLLQHYGVKTPYLDLVDNVWVALWFSLHQAKSVMIDSHEYVYYHTSEQEYAYILLIASDAIEHTTEKGVYKGASTSLVDLRNALPSYFLRPHAQHAYMIRKNEECPVEYSDLIVGIAKIPTRLGLDWLGSNEFLTVSSLFPAAYFDSGYGVLLKNYPAVDQGTIRQYGSIQIITD